MVLSVLVLYLNVYQDLLVSPQNSASAVGLGL